MTVIINNVRKRLKAKDDFAGTTKIKIHDKRTDYEQSPTFKKLQNMKLTKGLSQKN